MTTVTLAVSSCGLEFEAVACPVSLTATPLDGQSAASVDGGVSCTFTRYVVPAGMPTFGSPLIAPSGAVKSAWSMQEAVTTSPTEQPVSAAVTGALGGLTWRLSILKPANSGGSCASSAASMQGLSSQPTRKP